MSFKLSTTQEGLTKVTLPRNDLAKLQVFCIVKNIEYLIWDNNLFLRPIDADLLTGFNPVPTFNQFKQHTS